MRKLYYQIKSSYQSYDYTTTLRKIDEYLAIPDVGVDGSILLYYMNTLCRLGRLDDGYKIFEILNNYYKGSFNWKLTFANKCYANNRFDLLEKLFSERDNDSIDLDYLWIKSLFMYGYYDECSVEIANFFNKYNNSSVSAIVISKVDRIRKLIQYRDNGNNFVHTMYSNFLHEGNSLRSGDIVYFNKFVSKYEQENGLYKAYIVYKVIDNNVYAFATSDKHDDMVFDCRKYLNIGNGLTFSGDIVKSDICNVMEVKERLKEDDYLKICKYIYNKICVKGIIYNDYVKYFLNEYNNEFKNVKKEDILLFVIDGVKKFYYLIDIVDNKYKVVSLGKKDKGFYVENGVIEYIDKSMPVYDYFSVSSFCKKRLYYNMKEKVLKK